MTAPLTIAEAEARVSALADRAGWPAERAALEYAIELASAAMFRQRMLAAAPAARPPTRAHAVGAILLGFLLGAALWPALGYLIAALSIAVEGP